jgi:hypothetical protein
MDGGLWQTGMQAFNNVATALLISHLNIVEGVLSQIRHLQSVIDGFQLDCAASGYGSEDMGKSLGSVYQCVYRNIVFMSYPTLS